MENKVRVRFAPSPTGPLHIGGVRTALFNYLFAKHNGGDFLVRIEDTDQSRFVEGAEEYIRQSLEWAGIVADEAPWNPGDCGPYRQSERKEIYKEYAEQLVKDGLAYYAFDTSEELEEMRERLKAARVNTPQYNSMTRTQMTNSLTLSEEEVKERIESGAPYVIRLKVPKKEEIRLNDMVRGWVMVHSHTIDDKILMKSDGMPTYHLANVVDDHLMGITHVIRGEEWLPSAPLHVLLYKYLGWEDTMPRFAHLPLLLKPDGNGKLSKRDGDKMGFAVFPLEWKDPQSGDISRGFKEDGFLADAFINFLSFLGWNPGDEREFFTLQELCDEFTMERVTKAGTKFDIDKAKWYNQQYLKNRPDAELAQYLIADMTAEGKETTPEKAALVANQLKERVTFPQEIWRDGRFYFEKPQEYDAKTVKKKWKPEGVAVLQEYASTIENAESFTADDAKDIFMKVLENHEMKIGQVMPALRVAISGKGGGPDLMIMQEILGNKEVAERINIAIEKINKLKEGN
ncbi:glutamate--tRNA ligase [Flammeovirga sp. SJP92]|uniref:glutamate--tRNA ligase n=1 Tax=Flammeovirga sp. SJP92 TaxID=1775430 RepID=UPI000788CB88|nr:glutamate--tRNA ligase [Flammeovirga sp. SJP92]KXX70282.1 glutamate--tRNA ligase [Flammeovirga sp. SJP92]